MEIIGILCGYSPRGSSRALRKPAVLEGSMLGRFAEENALLDRCTVTDASAANTSRRRTRRRIEMRVRRIRFVQAMRSGVNAQPIIPRTTSCISGCPLKIGDACIYIGLAPPLLVASQRSQGCLIGMLGWLISRGVTHHTNQFHLKKPLRRRGLFRSRMSNHLTVISARRAVKQGSVLMQIVRLMPV